MATDVHRGIVRIYFARDPIVSLALLSFGHTGMSMGELPNVFQQRHSISLWGLC